MSLSNVSLSNFSWFQYFSTLKICSLLEFCFRNVLPKITSSFSALALKEKKREDNEYICMKHGKLVKCCVCVCVCVWLLLVLEAVGRRQDPTGVNEDSSASVEVFSETGLVNVDGRLPRLLRDVALSAPKHAERRAIQGVVQALATCCYTDRTRFAGRWLNNREVTSERMKMISIGWEGILTPVMAVRGGAAWAESADDGWASR